MAIRCVLLVLMRAATSAVAASIGQNVRGGHSMGNSARVHSLSPVAGDAATAVLAATETASLTPQGREVFQLLVDDLSRSAVQGTESFVSQCVAHVKRLVATIDYEYSDTHLKRVLKQECHLAKQNPSQFSTGFKTHYACKEFAHKLTQARMHELEHGDADKQYAQFCQEYHEHVAGEDSSNSGTVSNDPLSPNWLSSNTPTSRTCMWCLIILLVSCCCFGGAAHSDKGHGIGSVLGCLIPTAILLYVLFFTNLLHKVRHGESVGGFCLILTLWAVVQIIIGCCMLGSLAFGKTLHKDKYNNRNGLPVGSGTR